MIENESRPQIGTALYTGCGNVEERDKDSINSAFISESRFDSLDISNYIIVPIPVLKANDVMQKVLSLYLGGLVEGVKNKQNDVYLEGIASTILADYLPYSDEEFDEAFNDYQRIMSETEGKPRGSLPVNMFEAFQNANGDDLLKIRAYISLRSIVGKKPYAATNLRHIISRMYGYSSTKEMEREPFTVITPYRIKKAIECLEVGWGLKWYFSGRNHYASFSMSLKDLVMTVEGKGKSKLQAFRDKKKDEIDNVCLELFGKTKTECQEEMKRLRRERAERKAEKEQETKEPAPKEPEESTPKNKPLPEVTPKEEPKQEEPPREPNNNDERLQKEWLTMADRIKGEQEKLAGLMKRSLPHIEGRKAIVFADNEQQCNWLETSETFVRFWSRIKAAAKMPDLMLKAIVKEQERQREEDDLDF